MQRTRVPRRLPRVVVPVFALLSVAIPGATLLARQGFAVVHQCLPDPGAWGVIGMHLALVRESPDCPAGTVALGGEPGAAVTVLGVLAFPVLLAHLGVLLVAALASAVVTRALGRARVVVDAAARGVRALVGGRIVAVAVPGGRDDDRTEGVDRARGLRPRHLVLAVRTLRGPPGSAALA